MYEMRLGVGRAELLDTIATVAGNRVQKKHLPNRHNQKKHGRTDYAEIKGKASERTRETIRSLLVEHNLHSSI